MPKEIMNVKEAWPLYDTMFVTSNYYGQENDNLGWFQTFAAFSQAPSHSFFNMRTEASAGLQYCNKQSIDSMDYAYRAYSIGVRFFSPGVRTLGLLGTGTNWSAFDAAAAHFWEVELPRHCSLSLQVQQDIVSELPCFGAPPGYGPVGGGGAFAHDLLGKVGPNGTLNGAETPVMNATVSSGVPVIQNRFKFHKTIGIPRNGILEATVEVSQLGRDICANFDETFGYILNSKTLDEAPLFQVRYGIQVS